MTNYPLAYSYDGMCKAWHMTNSDPTKALPGGDLGSFRGRPRLSQMAPSRALVGSLKLDTKGSDPTFLIRAIGLPEKLAISFGFVFSNSGLKSQKLQLNPKKNYIVFVRCFLISNLFWEYLTHILQLNALNVFSTWKITYIELALSKV